MASRVVYELDEATRLDALAVGKGRILYAKREDRSQIHSYKWRGAFFCMWQKVQSGRRGPFVAASAGNHAQGVAAAARRLAVKAVIFMPCTTPRLKRDAVKALGGSFVSVVLTGDCFADAAREAERFCETNDATPIPPFDDLDVVAGQATVALELLSQMPALTRLFVPIGGGGLASGVAFAIKQIAKHRCRVIGVEVDGQQSMQASLEAGRRVELSSVDTYCDGTAVSKPGAINFELCSQWLDDVVTVSNAQVSAAIKLAWDAARFIPEPSGAIGLAAADRDGRDNGNDVVGTIVTGCNTDFKTLPRIVRQSQATEPMRRYFCFSISERKGALIRLLDKFLSDLNIVDFQYGKTDTELARTRFGNFRSGGTVAGLRVPNSRRRLGVS